MKLISVAIRRNKTTGIPFWGQCQSHLQEIRSPWTYFLYICFENIAHVSSSLGFCDMKLPYDEVLRN